MTLDEMINERNEQVESLIKNKCDGETMETVKWVIKWSMIQAHSQGKVDYAHEDLPEILRNHPGPF